MIGFYIERASWIAGITFLAAYILTFWRGRLLIWFAAALYSVGTLVNIGVTVYGWFLLTWMAYGLSDTGYPNKIALVGLPLPIAATGYAIAAVALLWPGIPQEKALRLGKILHLIVLPLLISIMIVAEFLRFEGRVYSELGWLVYALLWFRIRESYPNFSSSQNGEPLNKAVAKSDPQH